jgi:hypothetical protein
MTDTICGEGQVIKTGKEKKTISLTSLPLKLLLNWIKIAFSSMLTIQPFGHVCKKRGRQKYNTAPPPGSYVLPCFM